MVGRGRDGGGYCAADAGSGVEHVEHGALCGVDLVGGAIVRDGCVDVVVFFGLDARRICGGPRIAESRDGAKLSRGGRRWDGRGKGAAWRLVEVANDERRVGLCSVRIGSTVGDGGQGGGEVHEEGAIVAMAGDGGVVEVGGGAGSGAEVGRVDAGRSAACRWRSLQTRVDGVDARRAAGGRVVVGEDECADGCG